MRRLDLLISLALAGCLLAGGCKRQQTVKVDTVEESGDELASLIHVADPTSSIQLLQGFHDIEQNGWRWTKGRFAVTLKTPPGASKNGALLELKFTLPDPVIERVKSLTITANVNGTELERERYSKAGEYTFSKPVPAPALKADAVGVEFVLDNFLAAGAVEGRELGIIATSIGLLPQ